MFPPHSPKYTHPPAVHMQWKVFKRPGDYPQFHHPYSLPGIWAAMCFVKKKKPKKQKTLAL